MSAPKHTPEPWEQATQDANGAIWDAEGRPVAFVPCDDTRERYDGTIEEVKSPEALANARRIVACVNACAGIPTEALEAGALREALVKAYQVADYPHFHAHKGTSTEAIAAFEKLGIKGPAMDPAEIRAALAKVRP